MDLGSLLPVMIYDDRCYLCTKFAKIISFIAKRKMLIVGHYSGFGIEIKSSIFPSNYDSTRMFWLVDKKTAYGGRAALLPLLSSIITSKPRTLIHCDTHTQCDSECKTPKAVFLRTKSLFSNSEKIDLNLGRSDV